jgi:hypothetical protein
MGDHDDLESVITIGWNAQSAARKSGLRLIQEDVLVQHSVVVGVQRSFAETVNAYIEKKLIDGA